MKHARLLILAAFSAASPAWAVYAPVPDQNQGKEWTVALGVDVSHDDNIFGAKTGEISSFVYEASPKISFDASLTAQTFAAASYGLTVDHFTNRPGSDTLDSHFFSGRIAHAFSAESTLDVSDDFSINRNPESLLAGVAINTDQSYNYNEFNGRLTFGLAPKLGATVKVRSALYRYDDAALAESLDRTENLYGVSGNYDLLPEMKAVAEYRHEDVVYQSNGFDQNKHSDFVMGGFDYSVAKQVESSVRIGYQWRHRNGEQSINTPYVELSAKYDYAEGSFLSVGYIHTFEETSNVALYNDTEVNRFFVNLQHAITAVIVASGSVTYEPSVLQGRVGNPNMDDTTTRFGLALSYLPTKNWRLTLHYDYDHVDSQDVSRGQNRNRVGAAAYYTF